MTIRNYSRAESAVKRFGLMFSLVAISLWAGTWGEYAVNANKSEPSKEQEVKQFAGMDSNEQASYLLTKTINEFGHLIEEKNDF